MGFIASVKHQEAFKAKFETLGSNVSHETPKEAAGGLTP